jgi:hypothetical protein
MKTFFCFAIAVFCCLPALEHTASAQQRTDTYIFRLDKFHIDNTRARHEDTDTVSFDLEVGGRRFESQIKQMGDVNNGDHLVKLEFGPVSVDAAGTPVGFNYLILNAGNGSFEDVKKELAAQSNQFFADAAKEATAWWEKLALKASGLIIKEGIDALFADCDGWGAGDHIAFDGAALERLTAATGSYTETRPYPGRRSSRGCGSNSQYSVTWSVFRVPSKRTRRGSGFLIQSNNGKQGNFELLVPRAEGGMTGFFRNNDDAQMPWGGPLAIAPGIGRVDAVSLIQSSFSKAGNGPGNLEAVARIGNRLAGFWRPDTGGPKNSPGEWQGPYFFGEGVAVSGNPALIQSRNGIHGNFELVVPLAAGGIAHFFRNNDDDRMPWLGPFVFGKGAGHVDAVSLVQSNFSKAGNGPGNLEVVARIGNRLASFWRLDAGGPNSGPGEWQGPAFFAN